MCLEVLAFCDAVGPDMLTSKALQGPSAAGMRFRVFLPKMRGTAALLMTMGRLNARLP